jgi:putative glutamine amidotransferase
LKRSSSALVQVGRLLEQPDGGAGSELRLAAELGVAPGHDPQQRRLAGAVEAQDADLRAGHEGERDVLQHLLVGRMRPGQLVHREHVLAGHSAVEDRRSMTDIGSMAPLIGVTTSEVRRGDLATLRRHGEPPQHEMALGLTYMRAIELAGGVPVVLPPLADGIATLLDRLDGICLSGGPDLDPAAYGARAHEQLGPTEPQLDRFELELARAADAAGMPLLGICRGAQALNVARGGTLHQHVEGHRQTALATQPVHPVRIAPRSRAARVLATRAALVNSFHHQAVDVLGDDLVATAWAPDGTIEAIEDRRHPFLLAVQWHAETLVEAPAQLALFRALVEAANGRGALGTLAA